MSPETTFNEASCYFPDSFSGQFANRCTQTRSVAALGLAMRDLFPPSTNRRRNAPGRSAASLRLPGASADVKGELQGVHVRFDRDGGKDFLAVARYERMEPEVSETPDVTPLRLRAGP